MKKGVIRGLKDGKVFTIDGKIFKEGKQKWLE